MSGLPYLRSPWRTGRKVGRTIYAQLEASAHDDDPLIGVMDSPALAEAAVRAHNDVTSRGLYLTEMERALAEHEAILISQLEEIGGVLGRHFGGPHRSLGQTPVEMAHRVSARLAQLSDILREHGIDTALIPWDDVHASS
jgi:hypothetical protein